MASTVAELAIKMTVEDESQEGFSSVSRSVANLRRSAASELSSIGAAASQVGGRLKQGISDGAWVALGAIQTMAGGMGTAIGKVIDTVLSLKTLLIGLATGAILKTAWDWLIDPNIQLEQLELRIQSMVGNAEQAAEVFAFLQEQAVRPGLDMQQVFEAGMEWLPMAMRGSEDFVKAFKEGFEQAVLISFVKGKPLTEVMTAIEEFYGGYATSLARVLDLPPDVVKERMQAFGLMGKSSEELAAEHETLERRERDLGWAIQELTLAMQEGEKVQLGRVTSVTRQSAADLKQQHRLVQLKEQLEDVREELSENEAAQQRLNDGRSEGARTIEALTGLMGDAGVEAGFLADQEKTLGWQIDRVKNKFKELLQIMGLPVTKEGLYETFKRFGDWIDEHWDDLTSLATLVGEKIAGGIESMATWLENVDWQGVGSSLKSWADALAPIATALGEILKIINSWPPWAKTLLIAGVGLQAVGGVPLKAAGMAAGVGMGAGAKGAAGGATAGGVGVGALAGVGAIVAGAIAGAEIVKRTPGYRGMTSEEKLRRGLRLQPGVRLGGAGYDAWRRRQPVEVRVEVQPMHFQFDGSLSPAEEARLMEEWADAVDEGFVKPLTRRLEDGYRR